MTIRPVVDLAFTRANIPLHPTIETNSIEFMKKMARNGQAITFLNPVDIAEDVEAGEIRYLPIEELAAHPIVAETFGTGARRPRRFSEPRRRGNAQSDAEARSARQIADWHTACVEDTEKEPGVSERAFYWAELKTNDFRTLNPETTIAILPVAATEQHGPHLPVMTDTAIAQGMLDVLRAAPAGRSERCWCCRSSRIGKSNEHLLSPGTLSLSAETLAARAGRDRRRRLPRRLAQTGAGQLPRRQCARCCRPSRANCGCGSACWPWRRTGAGLACLTACTTPWKQSTASMPATSRPR